jgi:hypothetical protein
VETFLAKHSLMPLLYGLLPHLVGTITKTDGFREEVTLVHRICVTFDMALESHGNHNNLVVFKEVSTKDPKRSDPTPDSQFISVETMMMELL